MNVRRWAVIIFGLLLGISVTMCDRAFAASKNFLNVQTHVNMTINNANGIAKQDPAGALAVLAGAETFVRQQVLADGEHDMLLQQLSRARRVIQQMQMPQGETPMGYHPPGQQYYPPQRVPNFRY